MNTNTTDPVRAHLTDLRAAAALGRPITLTEVDELEAALAAEQASVEVPGDGWPLRYKQEQTSVQDDEYLAALDDLWKRVGNDDPLYRSFLRFVNTASVQAKAAQWQPIETAPRDGTNIVLVNQQASASGYWPTWRNPCWVGWPYLRGEPTHWMPLPAAPSHKVEG